MNSFRCWSCFALVVAVVGVGCSRTPGDDESGGDAGTAMDCEAGICSSARPEGTPPDACPSGRYAAGDKFDGQGVCLPARPQGTPQDACPSERYAAADAFTDEGLCLPEYPEMTDWSCPEGWNGEPAFVDTDGNANVPEGMEQYQHCEPPSLPESCPAGRMPVLGESDCQRIGLACPEGENRFHDENTIRESAPDFGGDVVYADPEVSSSGDGSRSAPHESLAAAIDAAGTGDIVALAPAAFTESVDIDDELAVVGSCAGQTRIEAPSESDDYSDALVEMTGGNAVLSNVTLTGGRVGLALETEGSGGVDVRSVDLAETRHVALWNKGTEANLEDLYVRDTQPQAGNQKDGWGMFFASGATAELRRVTLAGNHGNGLAAADPETELEAVEDLVVRNTRPQVDDDKFGQGVWLFAGATATFDRAVVDGNHHFGVILTDDQTKLDARDLVVRDTQPAAHNDGGGRGLYLESGSKAELERTLLEGNHTAGISVYDEGTTLAGADNLVVRNTRPRAADQTAGYGVELSTGATAALSRTLIDRNHSVGLIAARAGTELTRGEDVVVRDTRPSADDEEAGWGIRMQSGAVATLRRVLVDGNRSAGAFVEGQETNLKEAVDFFVRGTRPRASDDKSGVGVAVEAAASATLRRAEFVGNRTVGLLAAGPGSSLEGVRDLVVRETKPHKPDGAGGFGVQVVSGATAEFDGALLEKSHTAGLVANEPGTKLEAVEDLVVRETQPRESNDKGGVGLLVRSKATATLRRALFDDNHVLGLVAADRGTNVERARDVTVRNTRLRETDGKFGYGIQFVSGATGKLDRLRFDGNRGVGFAVGIDATVERANDVIIEDTGAKEPGGKFGDGLYVFRSGSLQMNRSFIAGNARNGMIYSRSEATSVANAAVTNNQIGVTRQLENDLEFTGNRVEGNQKADDRCTEQCYDEPESPESLNPAAR